MPLAQRPYAIRWWSAHGHTEHGLVVRRRRHVHTASPLDVMHHYQAFGLRIDSDMPFEGLVDIGQVDQAALPDVTVERGGLDVERLPSLNDDGEVIAGRAEGVMRFVVKEGRSITYDPYPAADIDFVKSLLTGELLATLLRQRGLLVLHGSAVAGGEGAVGFVGFSGWGKSTLATYFCANGYSMLTDDVLALDVREEGVTVFPGHGQVKLRDDVGAMFMDDHRERSAVHAAADKRLYVARVENGGPVPLRRLYFLEGTTSPETRLEPLSRLDALQEVLRHTRVTQLIKDSDFVATHLKQSTTLIRQVPTRMLKRVRSLDHLPLIHRLVEEDMARSGVAP